MYRLVQLRVDLADILGKFSTNNISSKFLEVLPLALSPQDTVLNVFYLLLINWVYCRTIFVLLIFELPNELRLPESNYQWPLCYQ